jgi:hypothetical protein
MVHKDPTFVVQLGPNYRDPTTKLITMAAATQAYRVVLGVAEGNLRLHLRRRWNAD